MITTLDDLGQLFDGPHATPSRKSEGPYFLNIASLQGGRLNLAESDHVSEADFVTWTRRVQPMEGDLLFSYETRLGEAALMPRGVRACLGRRMALLRPDRSRVHPKYLLYYYHLSPEFQSLVERNTIHGATVNRISLSTMGSWPIKLPELSEQRAIAQVLGALDDKIVANASAVRTARGLARALFLSIPTSRRRAETVGSILVLEYGRSLPSTSRKPGPVEVFGSGGLTGYHNSTWLPSRGVIVGRKGTVGAVYGSPDMNVDEFTCGMAAAG